MAIISNGANRLAAIVGAAALMAATAVTGPSAWAHHGWSSYDADKAVKVEVPLAEVRYRNPHAEGLGEGGFG